MKSLTAADIFMHPSDFVHVLSVIQSHVYSSSLQEQPSSSDASVQSDLPLHLTKH